MHKDIKVICISVVSIIIAFFLGYMYNAREYQLQLSQIQDSPIYIDISSSTRGITIKNTPENIYFRVDKTLMQTGSIDLK